MRETYEAMRAQQDLTPTFRKRPSSALGGITNVAWTYDDDVDLDYHVRRSALPAPGRVRELLELTGRLHGTLLDRHRPLWEMHPSRASTTAASPSTPRCTTVWSTDLRAEPAAGLAEPGCGFG